MGESDSPFTSPSFELSPGISRFPATLAESHIAILGLGLMGGSLALALRGRCARLLGIDPDPDVLSLARQWKLVDQASIDPAKLLPDANLIVLATPVKVIIKLIDDLPELQPEKAIVLDLGSTKSEIVQAMQKLPVRFDPIGGHPMCGKERSSLANADARLFQGATFALTPLPRTSIQARALAEELVQAIGAIPFWLDPETHDRWTAATSHLPYLIANALAFITPNEAQPLVGPGLRSTVRLAATPLHVMLDILVTNRMNVLAGMKRFHEHLEDLEKCLADMDDETLRDLLTQGGANYEALIRAWSKIT
jgi:prephenate dehydrogenase